MTICHAKLPSHDNMSGYLVELSPDLKLPAAKNPNTTPIIAQA